MDDSIRQDVSEPSRRTQDQMASRNLENLSSMVRVTQKEVYQPINAYLTFFM